VAGQLPPNVLHNRKTIFFCCEFSIKPKLFNHPEDGCSKSFETPKHGINTWFRNPTEDYYRGADKSLARPGRKQATATEDFDVHISYL
jgi:hypothetical protein